MSGFMVASAHRRTGANNSALHVYEKLHDNFPENIECLKCLIAMCKAVEKPYYHYQEKLAKVSSSMDDVLQ